MLPLNIYCPLLNPFTTSGQRWWFWDLPVESIADCQLQSLTPWIRTSFMLRPCFLWVATNQWMNMAGVLVLACPYLAWDCSNGQTWLRTPHWLSNYDLTVSLPGVFSLSCHGGLTCIMIWRPPCSLSVPDPSFSIHHKYLPQYIFLHIWSHHGIRSSKNRKSHTILAFVKVNLHKPISCPHFTVTKLLPGNLNLVLLGSKFHTLPTTQHNLYWYTHLSRWVRWCLKTE